MSTDVPEGQPDSVVGFKCDSDQDGANATDGQKPPGEALAGSPGNKNDDCKLQYREQRHELFGAESSERSPSGGWRRVYAEMGVSVNAER